MALTQDIRGMWAYITERLDEVRQYVSVACEGQSSLCMDSRNFCIV